MACGASVWNPCAATGEAAGMAAAVIARRAAAASAALWRAWNEVRNAWTGRARILERLTSGEPELCAFAPAKSTFRKGLPLDSLKGDEALRLHVLERIRLRESRPRRLRRRVVQPGEDRARQRHAGGDPALGLRRDGGDLGPARAGAVGRLGRGARSRRLRLFVALRAEEGEELRPRRRRRRLVLERRERAARPARERCRAAVSAQGREELAVVGAARRGAPDIVDLHAGRARALELERLGDALGHVHDPVRVIGAAVVDAHDHRAPVLEVRDPGIARQRHRRVRGGDRMTVEDLAVGGEPAMEGGAIPGGEAGAGIAGDVLARDVGLAGDLIGPADELAPAALRHRLAVLDDAGTGDDAVFRIDGAPVRGDPRRAAA